MLKSYLGSTFNLLQKYVFFPYVTIFSSIIFAHVCMSKWRCFSFCLVTGYWYYFLTFENKHIYSNTAILKIPLDTSCQRTWIRSNRLTEGPSKRVAFDKWCLQHGGISLFSPKHLRSEQKSSYICNVNLRLAIRVSFPRGASLYRHYPKLKGAATTAALFIFLSNTFSWKAGSNSGLVSGHELSILFSCLWKQVPLEQYCCSQNTAWCFVPRNLDYSSM